MSIVHNQTAYWDRVSRDKTFTLPVDCRRFAAHVSRDRHVLEYGCGYGRICRELWECGYRNIIGIDPSPNMIERGRKEFPYLALHVMKGSVPEFEPDSFDALVLFGILTCIPSSDVQQKTMYTVSRLLRPGGILYLSDFPLQHDPRNTERYKKFQREFGTYGVFRLPEGVILRHHDMRWIEFLTAAFTKIDLWETDVITMNRNPARAFHYLGRKMPVGQ